MFNVYQRLDYENGHFMTCSLLNESVQTSSIGEIFNFRVNTELGGRGMKMLFPRCNIAYFVDNITKHAPPKAYQSIPDTDSIQFHASSGWVARWNDLAR